MRQAAKTVATPWLETVYIHGVNPVGVNIVSRYWDEPADDFPFGETYLCHNKLAQFFPEVLDLDDDAHIRMVFGRLDDGPPEGHHRIGEVFGDDGDLKLSVSFLDGLDEVDVFDPIWELVYGEFGFESFYLWVEIQ